MKNVLVFILLLFVSSAFGQRSTDLELWIKLGGKVDLAENWKLDFEEQIRFDESIDAVKNYHTEAELKFKAAKKLDLIFVQRFIRRNDNSGDNQGYENLIRFQVGGAYKHESRQFEFKHRLLFQHRNEMGVRRDEGDVPEKVIRYKLNTEYKIKSWKYDPQLSIEYFNPLGKPLTNEFNSIRFGFGTERAYDKFGELGIDYLFDITLGRPVQQAAHIISLKYRYKF